jgi:membrane protein
LLLLGFRPHAISTSTSDSPHARDPPSPRTIRSARRRPRDWTKLLGHVVKRVDRQRVVLVAAGVTFYSLLALFPGIAALVALYGLVADPVTIAQHVDMVAGVLPSGAVDVIRDEIARIIAQPRGALGLTFLGSLAFSLWSANGGVKALFEALDVVFVVKETRGFIGVTILSLTFVVAGIVFVLIAMAGVVVVPIALRHIGMPPLGKSIVSLIRWPILFAIAALAMALTYRFGADHKIAQRRWVTWGSATAALAWLAMSVLFSWYTEHFGSYNKTYGSLGAVVGFMTWIWLSAIVFLIGAEIDAVLARRDRDTPVAIRSVATGRH